MGKRSRGKFTPRSTGLVTRGSQRAMSSLALLAKQHNSNYRTPVGRRLANFLQQWQKMTANVYVLNITARGYSLEFNSLSPERFLLTKLPRDLKFSPCYWEKVLTPVPEKLKRARFYWHVFVIKKPSGKFWLILSLKPLNQQLPLSAAQFQPWYRNLH